MKNHFFSFRDWVNENGLLLALLITFINVITITIYLVSFKKFDPETISILEKISTPVISLLGFILVIVSLAEISSSNNSKTSAYFYDIVEKEINQLINKAENEDFSLVWPYFLETKGHPFENEKIKLHHIYYIILKLIELIKSSKASLEDIGKTKTEDQKILVQQYEIATNCLLQIKYQLFNIFYQADFIIRKIKAEKRLSTYHQDLLIEKIVTNIFGDVFIFFSDDDEFNFKYNSNLEKPKYQYLFDDDFLKIFETPLNYKRYSRIIDIAAEPFPAMQQIKKLMNQRKIENKRLLKV